MENQKILCRSMISTGGVCLGGQSALKRTNTHHTMLPKLVPGTDSTIATASVKRNGTQSVVERLALKFSGHS